MKELTIILAVIVIVEGLVEYGTTFFEMLETKEYKKAIKQLCAVVVCTFFCFQCSADLFAYCGLTFAVPWLGVALTGVFGSRGSNYVADLVKALQGLKAANGVSLTGFIASANSGADETEA